MNDNEVEFYMMITTSCFGVVLLLGLILAAAR